MPRQLSGSEKREKSRNAENRNRCSQDEGHRQFRGAGVMHARRVTQRRGRRQQRQELLVARGQGLHHLQLGHLGGPLENRGPPHVGQHIEGDLVDRAVSSERDGPLQGLFRRARPRPLYLSADDQPGPGAN